ncbi:hypothetical protein CPB83DRAFT_566011 [Crepidotus variabilis]|uniref:Uncharacterized protein n=1 Tax=Crepidotus variabilis TaxID=179855 RepID=A0A9P6JLT3_9AGAR|nr:hypothetical protein CPB83DRAFT_566011 [Crepidotus variabilis]
MFLSFPGLSILATHLLLMITKSTIALCTLPISNFVFSAWFCFVGDSDHEEGFRLSARFHEHHRFSALNSRHEWLFDTENRWTRRIQKTASAIQIERLLRVHGQTTVYKCLPGSSVCLKARHSHQLESVRQCKSELGDHQFAANTQSAQDR